MAMRSSKGSRSITVEKEGYLWIKRNVSVLKAKEKSWQQKYVVLRKSFGDGTCLEWYEHFEAFIAHKNPTKLQLDAIEYIGPVDMGKEYTYAFILFCGGQNKLQMAAKTEAERSEWTKALNHCIQNGRKSNPTSPKMQRSSEKTSYPVKLKDYARAPGQDSNPTVELLQDGNLDFVMTVGPRSVSLIAEQKVVLSWYLEYIKSYESRPLEQNSTQKLLSITTGRRSSTGAGTFNFVTAHSDTIKNQISLNTKRSYVQKMNSQDNFNENSYSCSPERNASLSQRSLCSFPRRCTLPSSKEGAIPFHEYDPSPSAESYGPYVQSPNGYIQIFTDPKKVEENRLRNRSRSSTSRPSNIVDSPCDSSSGYVPVLASEEGHTSSYITVLPEDSSHPHNHHYIELIGEQEPRPNYIDVLPPEDENHPAYITVIGDEQPSKSPHTSIQREEIYIDITENKKRYESREQHFQSRSEHVETSYRSREEHVVSRHESQSHQEIDHVTHKELRQTRESTTSARSSSPRWPHSATSQTSTEFSSISSENEVFPDREINMVTEVFAEELTKSASAINKDTSGSKPEDNSLQSKPTLLQTKPILGASKSATLPTKSDGLATESDVNCNELNGGEARGWHSENEASLTYNSGNSTSTSESDHTRDSCEDSDQGEGSTGEHSLRDHVVEGIRDRSRTTGDLSTLKMNGKELDPMLMEYQRSLTNPQQFTANRHPPLERTSPFTKEEVTDLINQLENPIQGMNQFPPVTKNRSTVEIKYICSQCGWHKKSKKRSSLRPNFRSKLCPICNNPVTKQDAKNNKNKDKSSGGILHKIRKKRRSSDEKIEKKDPLGLKPDRPSISAEPLFIKRVRDHTFVGRHSPSMDPKRSGLGIAPSPLTALHAISIDGGEPRGSVSHDDGGGKSSLVASLSDGGTPNGVASSHKRGSTSPGNSPLGRTTSSPPLGGGREAGSAQESLVVDIPECDKIPRKNSGLTLATLPEVEDASDPNHQTCHSPCTPPPMIPPRTRPPPVPPRRGSSPLAIPREENAHILRRAQTDPTFPLPPKSSPKMKPKSRISRTLTDPGKDENVSNNSLRHAFSLGNLLEGGDEGLLEMKVVSLSLDNGIEAPPPPLPPRRGSGQANQSQPPLPLRAASNENERLVNTCESPRSEPRSSNDARRPLPDRTTLPGSASPKLPLSSKRSLDAKRDFQTRKPVYSQNVGE